MKSKNNRSRVGVSGGVGTVRRNACSAEFLTTMLSDFFSPQQLASQNIHEKKDYGMDNEVIAVFQNIQSKYGPPEYRNVLPFQVFKMIQAYLQTPDLRVLTGNAQFQAPESSIDSKVMSKLERIRGEVQAARTTARLKIEDHVNLVLDYVLEKAAEEHRVCELVDYDDLENQILKIIWRAPKKDNFRPKGEERHLVFVQQNTVWPETSYVISLEIYDHFPALKPFFQSTRGPMFVLLFNQYLRIQFPNMQENVLDRVNAFTNHYFLWLCSLLEFHLEIPEYVRWKYLPMACPKIIITPFCREASQELIPVRVFHSTETTPKKKYFFFLDEMRLLMQKLARHGCQFSQKEVPQELPLDGPAPRVHRIAEVFELDHVLKIISYLCPPAAVLCRIVPYFTYSWNGCRFPIVSPYNTHCIPAPEAFQRLVEILVSEVRIGKKIPLTFSPLTSLVRKMEELFCQGSQVYKTMVDRKRVHELMGEATALKGKFNGKLKKPQGKIGKVDVEASAYTERQDAFLAAFPQFTRFACRGNGIEGPVPEPMTPPGEPTIDFIVMYLYGGFETVEDKNKSQSAAEQKSTNQKEEPHEAEKKTDEENNSTT